MRRRQSDRFYLRLKRNPLMAAVAEGLVLGVAAPAQADRRPAREVKRSAICIAKGEVTLKPQRAIVSNRDPSHANLLEIVLKIECRRFLSHSPGLIITRMTMPRNSAAISPCTSLACRAYTSMRPSR